MSFHVSHTGSKLLQLEALVATVLLAGAIGLDAWQSLGLWEALEWSSWSASLGVVAAIPPLGVILLLESSWSKFIPGLGHFRHSVTTVLVSLIGRVRMLEGVVLSGLAGISEEVFFRGVLQPVFGIVFASVLFGLCHTVNLSYAVWAVLMGGYLGWLAEWHGNLWSPIVAHTVIDLVGLWYICCVVAPRVDRDSRT